MERHHAGTFGGRLAAALALFVLCGSGAGQEPEPPKRPEEPDPRLAKVVEDLEEAWRDRRQRHDDQAAAALRELVDAAQADEPLHEDDERMLLQAFTEVLTRGRLRKPESRLPYEIAAEGLGALGEEGVGMLLRIYERKRFPRKPDWEPMRAKLIEQIGNLHSDQTREFLLELVQRSGEHQVLREAGVQLGRFGDADGEARKEIVDRLSSRLSGFESLARESPVDQSQGLNLNRQNAIELVEVLQRPWCNAMADLTDASYATGADWATWYRENKRRRWQP